MTRAEKIARLRADCLRLAELLEGRHIARNATQVQREEWASANRAQAARLDAEVAS